MALRFLELVVSAVAAIVEVGRRFWPLLWFLLRVEEPGRCFVSSPVDVRVKTRKVFLLVKNAKTKGVT